MRLHKLLIDGSFMLHQAVGCLLFLSTLPSSFGQSFIDPGFENDVVSAGHFIRPAGGAWYFGNDASVVRPFAPNSSTEPLSTWSATFPALAGEQYASTYAGADQIRQTVLFPEAGLYEISVYAAAPSGEVAINQNAQTLVKGAFTFRLDNASIGSEFVLSPGTEWQKYSSQFTIPAPGSYTLGILNTLTAAYFINYDNFDIQAVPEPGSYSLVLLGLALALGVRSQLHLKNRGRP
jgi:hypothetical protein